MHKYLKDIIIVLLAMCFAKEVFYFGTMMVLLSWRIVLTKMFKSCLASCFGFFATKMFNTRLKTIIFLDKLMKDYRL